MSLLNRSIADGTILSSLLHYIVPCEKQPSRSSCAGAAREGSTGAPAIISFGGQEAEQAVFQPIIDRFNADNPALQVVFVPLDEPYEQAFGSNGRITVTQVAATTVDTAISYGIGARDVRAGWLLNLSPFIDVDPA